jgi:hypothetical protein
MLLCYLDLSLTCASNLARVQSSELAKRISDASATMEESVRAELDARESQIRSEHDERLAELVRENKVRSGAIVHSLS